MKKSIIMCLFHYAISQHLYLSIITRLMSCRPHHHEALTPTVGSLLQYAQCSLFLYLIGCCIIHFVLIMCQDKINLLKHECIEWSVWCVQTRVLSVYSQEATRNKHKNTRRLSGVPTADDHKALITSQLAPIDFSSSLFLRRLLFPNAGVPAYCFSLIQLSSV